MASTPPFPFAWYAVAAAGVTVNQTQAIATSSETTGTITMNAEFSAKKVGNSADFNLASDKLSFVDLADGKTYVYNSTTSFDNAHKQLVESRSGEQYAIITVKLYPTAALTSTQYGSYTVSVSAGANDSTTKDILYIWQTAGDTSVSSWAEASFGKSLTLGTMTIDANHYDVKNASKELCYTQTFIVAAKGLDQDQRTEYNSGTLTVSVVGA